MAYKNMYDGQDFFKIIINGQEIFIDEPVGWDKLDISLTRDKDYYGFNYEFADAKAVVSFSWKGRGGGQYIKQQYDLYRGDAIVLFQYGYFDEDDQQRPQFTGNLNFNEYNADDEGVSLSVEKTAFESLFRTRFDTAISLSATKSLDDKDITALTPFEIKLHSKKIVKAGIANTPDGTTNDIELQDLGTYDQYFSLLPDLNEIQTTEVAEIQSSMPMFEGEDPAGMIDIYQFIAKEAGTVTVAFSGKADSIIAFYQAQGGVTSNVIKCTPVICHKSTTNVVTRYPGPAVYFTMSDPKLFYIPNWEMAEWAVTRDLNKDDKLYWFWVFDTQLNYVKPLVASGKNIRTKSKVSQETIAPASKCNVFGILDALTQAVYSATGQNHAVKSNFFGIGGCGEKFCFTNGFQIRRFHIDDRPVNVTLKNIITTMSAIWNIGFGFQTLPDGSDVLIVEPMDFFFGQGEALRIESIYEYTEMQNKTDVFNELEVGYEKFSDEDISSLDEFNTYIQLLTPIRTYKQKKIIKSPAIASGYSIEIQRREQFNETPNESVTGDDNLFIIAYRKGRPVYTVLNGLMSPNIVNGQPSFQNSAADIPINPGDTFTIEGGGLNANSGVTFTVLNIVSPGIWHISPTCIYDMSDPLRPFTVTITGPSLPIGALQAETNEPFDTVDGLISPSTSYNLRINPAFMVRNWASYLNISNDSKGPNEKIKNTFQKQNNAMKIKYAATEPCTLGINQPVGIADDIVLSDFKFGSRPYGATMAQFKTQMKYDRLNVLKQLLRGEVAGDPRNYGHIVFTDLFRVPWRAHVNKITYNPATEEALFEVFKISPL